MRIAVIGAGHMGSWFIRELSKTFDVAIYDIDKKKMKNLACAKHLSKKTEIATFKPQLFLNAVNLKNTVKVFNSYIKYLPEDCIIADITSIKGDLPKFYRTCKNRFVSIHPMFGPNFANLNDIRDENVILISESDGKAKNFFRLFFKNFNLQVSEYSFLMHDELMAYSLTLPFSSSIVFSACINNNTVPGTTFARHKEIARKLFREDDYLLSEILFNPYSLKQLEKICSKLEFLKHVIKAKDYDESHRFFKKLKENLELN
jgi:prephenate dehydrogenase